MKLHFLPVLSLLTASVAPAFAQSRFSVGITAAPVLNHNRTNVTFKVPTGTGQLMDTTFAYRSSIGGFSVGLSVQYAFTSRWSLSTGVWLTQLRTTQPFPFTSGNVPARLISSSYQIPLLLNYRLANRRLSPYVTVGALGYFGGKTTYKPVEGSGFQKTSVKFGQALNVQAVVGAGVAYQLKPRWSLTVQPLLIWRFPPERKSGTRYNQYVSYQIQGQVQLAYSF